MKKLIRYLALSLIEPLEARIKQLEQDYRYWMDSAHYQQQKLLDLNADMAKLGVYGSGDNLRVRDNDEEAKCGRLWNDMTPEQKNLCREKWKLCLSK